jgi:Family of unknown function (DUF5330)
MFFLLRMAFWLGLVLILLPTGSGTQNTAHNNVGAAQAITAASETVHDLRGFCAREPNACTVGTELASTMGHRARAGAKMLYDLLSEAMSPNETGSLGDAEAARGSAALPRDSENTLTPADLAPAWRAPRSQQASRHPA